MPVNQDVPRYVLLLGANVAPNDALERALLLLQRSFGVLRQSAILASPDRDGDCVPPYLNCAVEIASPLEASALKVALREIEAKCGRARPAAEPGLCAMDIDIALRFADGAWQVVDQKATSADYARIALREWWRPYIEISKASLEDARAIAETQVLSWQHAYAELLSSAYLAALSVPVREHMWREAIINKTPELWLAKTDGVLAGFAAFGPSRDPDASPQTAELMAIYLAPSFWSQGIGYALWLACQARIETLGFKHVSLWVLLKNARAIHFYEDVGFRAQASSVKQFELGGITLEEIRYTRTVSG
jgi:2-amino-4-hydroxy-6-hydroxymethyldihydropteridine diphosphokinase